MSFAEFCKKEHQRRVAHFVRMANAGITPSLANAMDVFGFCERDAKPIVADTIQGLANA
jgi:hypothetical protein